MLRGLIIGAVLTAALILSALAAAPDALDVDSEHYSLVFENDRVRVIRIEYDPGEKSVMHSHMDSVVVALTDTETRMHLPDGSSVDDALAAGHAQWADAGDHLPENISGQSMEALLIELKD
jgi:hypothetical protein